MKNLVSENDKEIILTINKYHNPQILFETYDILKKNWPLYELWIDDNFNGFWEFIPDHHIGVNSNAMHCFWTIIQHKLIILNHRHQPVIIFDKVEKDFKAIGIYDRRNYHLKYIET